MPMYHAVMLDETACEFGVSVEASSKDAARLELLEDYPESRIVQIESPEDTAARERRMEERLQRELDGDIFADEYDDYVW